MLSVNDVTGEIAFNASIRRDTLTDEFYLASLDIDSFAYTIDYGPIAIPHRVCIKFVGGAPVIISLDSGSSYPFYMDAANDFMVLRLNPDDIPTIQLTSLGPIPDTELLTSNVIVTVEPL
jgi:hypothetical protein